MHVKSLATLEVLGDVLDELSGTWGGKKHLGIIRHLQG